MHTQNSEKWLALHGEKMIDCPYQPGNLRLSASSCAKRFACAHSKRYSKLSGDSPQLLAFKMNLTYCRNCKIGASLVPPDEAA